MSSSPSSLTTPAPGREGSESPLHVSAFPYRDVSTSAAGRIDGPEGLTPGSDADDAVAHENRTRELGRQEGEAAARKNFVEQLARERSAIAAALASFATDRENYYQQVEGQIVQLALSIARHVLHRESQVDPLLLAGIVRVALDKIRGATDIVLSVNPIQAGDLRDYLTTQMPSDELPKIIEDSALEPGRCKLQTSMGVAELGIEVQFKEIERGLMDLLAVRPPPKP